MELTYVHVAHPTWFKLALMGTFIFPFVAIPLSRRVRDPVALLMVLIAGNLAATWAGLLRLAQGMSLSGAGHRAASAGGAEAQMPLFIGWFVVTLTAAICAFRLRSQQHRTPATLYLGLVFVAGVAVEVWFTWFVTRVGRTFAPRLETIAQTGAVFFLGLVAVFLVLTFRHYSEPASPRSLSAVFTVIGILSGAVAIALWRFARSLTAVALGQ